MTSNVETLFLLQWNDLFLSTMESGFSMMASKPGHLFNEMNEKKNDKKLGENYYISNDFVYCKASYL